MRRFFAVISAVLLSMTCFAVADGIEAPVNPVSVRIGDIANGGVSVIGVVRNDAGAGILLCVTHADTACFAACSDWIGGTKDRVPYLWQSDGRDSLLLYSYSMSVSDSDEKRLDSRLLVGMEHTNEYATPFDIASCQREPYKEFSLYGRRLSNTERRKVETYYAIKYGLTLDQQEPNDYISSNGDVVWDGIENRAYRYDVAGIGVDQSSGLSHLTSSGINTNRTPQIRAKRNVEDGMYLTWSHNGGAMQFGEKGPDETRTLGRVWKMCATGNWEKSPADISFSVGGEGGLPKLKAGETYVLLMGSSEDSIQEGTGQTLYRCRYTDGGDIVYDDVDVSRNRIYFTIASVPLSEQEVKDPIQYVSISPNPVSDGEVCIEIGLYRESDAEVIIYNSIGQKIVHGVYKGEAYYKYRGYLPVQGTYIAVVTSGEGMSVNKIIRK